MQSKNPNKPIDLNLVDQVVQLIPDPCWYIVHKVLIENIVDRMAPEVLKHLTNDDHGYGQAELILLSYYQEEETRHADLIVDAFKILGEEYTLDLLDGLKLNNNNHHD